jgi:hypothetical protein
MPLAALLSLALAAAEPSATIRLAQAGPVQTGRPIDDERRAQAMAEGNPFPEGAPTDDYGLLAWCEGALNQHMLLKPRVWSEVERIERQFPDPGRPVEQSLAEYDAQSAEGQLLIERIERALTALEAQGQGGAARRDQAMAQGASIWRGADTTAPREVAQMWMSWALPNRCATTATRIAGQ